MKPSEKSEAVFSGPIADRIRSGEIVRLAYVFWNPVTEKLVWCFPDTFTFEEATAILARYGLDVREIKE